MTGALFAISSALAFAFNNTLIRRAVLKVPDAGIGTLISVPMALPLYFMVLAFTGQTSSILGFSRQGYIWLSLAGVLHFVVGRTLFYHCVQLVGANIAGILRRTSILISVVLGITLLREPLSWKLALGVLFIIVGISLPGLSAKVFRDHEGRLVRIPAKALMLGFSCGLAWGVSPIFIKLGLSGSQSPIAGAFISYLAATATLSLSLLNPNRRTASKRLTPGAAGLFFIAGLFSCSANLTRYVALGLAPASVVAPLVSITPIFLLIFSFVFNRRLEIFSRPVIVGTVTVVIGTILLI
jgi:drug/metabolite transporter (DMT)-like permease